MDLLNNYRQIIMNILREYTKIKYANADVRNKIVFDQENDRYLVMSDGWEKKVRRIHGCLIDIEIIDGKIWVQRDGTEDGVTQALLDAGIPKEIIVLGFKDPQTRKHTGFAVA